MLYAFDENKNKIEPTKSVIGFCPTCGSEMIPKMGNYITHHWAHKSSCSDNWHYEPMSEWHRDWQNKFPKEWQEVTVTKNGKTHRADVMLPNGVVIEFQNSKISMKDIEAREAFWEKLIWFFNWDNLSNYTLEPREEHINIFTDKKTPTGIRIYLLWHIDVLCGLETGDDCGYPFKDRIGNTVWITFKGYTKGGALSFVLVPYSTSLFPFYEKDTNTQNLIFDFAKYISADIGIAPDDVAFEWLYKTERVFQRREKTGRSIFLKRDVPYSIKEAGSIRFIESKGDVFLIDGGAQEYGMEHLYIKNINRNSFLTKYRDSFLIQSNPT